MLASILVIVLLSLITFRVSSLSYGDSQAIIISQPVVKDLEDHDLAQAAVNSQVVLSFKIRHTGDGEQSYTVLIEVRDADQVTIYLQFQKGTMTGNSEIEIGSSWTPTALGDYEVRSFVISELQQPEILSPIVTSKAVVSFVEARKQVQMPEQNIPQEEPVTPPELDKLRRYALDAINKDREKFGLAPVQLSYNEAAQIHAEDVFETRKISHWMMNGEKPYMTYSRYGGEGNVGQNVAVSGYDEDYQSCKIGIFLCEKTDPYVEIDGSQYSMMYEDEDCCDNGHRDNILDKYHTHVSIGIVYDDYFFALVQNFEDQYIDWTNTIDEEDAHSDIVSMSGQFKNNIDVYTNNDVSFYSVSIYYDPIPTRETYEDNVDELSYGGGEEIAIVVEPAPQDYYYEQPSDYMLVEAEFWRVTDSDFQIIFKTDDLQRQHGDGVYSITVWCQGAQDDYFIASSISLYKD